MSSKKNSCINMLCSVDPYFYIKLEKEMEVILVKSCEEAGLPINKKFSKKTHLITIDFQNNKNKISVKEERYNFSIGVNKELTPLVRLKHKLIEKSKSVGQMDLYEIKLENIFNVKISLSNLFFKDFASGNYDDDIQFYFAKFNYFDEIALKKNSTQRPNVVNNINDNFNNNINNNIAQNKSVKTTNLNFAKYKGIIDSSSDNSDEYDDYYSYNKSKPKDRKNTRNNTININNLNEINDNINKESVNKRVLINSQSDNYKNNVNNNINNINRSNKENSKDFSNKNIKNSTNPVGEKKESIQKPAILFQNTKYKSESDVTTAVNNINTNAIKNNNKKGLEVTNINITKASEKKEKALQSPSSTNKKTCTICFDEIKDQAILNRCSHEYCYECIRQWSDNSNKCPLCKAQYSYIIHFKNKKRIREKVKIREFLSDGSRFLFEDSSYFDSDDSENDDGDKCILCDEVRSDNFKMIYCDACEVYCCHQSCCNLSDFPEEEWYCPSCLIQFGVEYMINYFYSDDDFVYSGNERMRRNKFIVKNIGNNDRNTRVNVNNNNNVNNNERNNSSNFANNLGDRLFSLISFNRDLEVYVHPNNTIGRIYGNINNNNAFSSNNRVNPFIYAPVNRNPNGDPVYNPFVVQSNAGNRNFYGAMNGSYGNYSPLIGNFYPQLQSVSSESFARNNLNPFLINSNNSRNNIDNAIPNNPDMANNRFPYLPSSNNFFNIANRPNSQNNNNNINTTNIISSNPNANNNNSYNKISSNPNNRNNVILNPSTTLNRPTTNLTNPNNNYINNNPSNNLNPISVSALRNPFFRNTNNSCEDNFSESCESALHGCDCKICDSSDSLTPFYDSETTSNNYGSESESTISIANYGVDVNEILKAIKDLNYFGFNINHPLIGEFRSEFGKVTQSEVVENQKYLKDKSKIKTIKKKYLIPGTSNFLRFSNKITDRIRKKRSKSLNEKLKKRSLDINQCPFNGCKKTIVSFEVSREKKLELKNYERKGLISYILAGNQSDVNKQLEDFYKSAERRSRSVEKDNRKVVKS